MVFILKLQSYVFYIGEKIKGLKETELLLALLFNHYAGSINYQALRILIIILTVMKIITIPKNNNPTKVNQTKVELKNKWMFSIVKNKLLTMIENTENISDAITVINANLEIFLFIFIFISFMEIKV